MRRLFQNSSLFQMTFARLREFRREPSAMVFVLSMPILWMLGLGLAFSDKAAEQYGIAIRATELKTAFQDQIHQALHDPQIQLHEGTDSQIGRWLRTGTVLLELRLVQDNRVEYHFDAHNTQAKRARDFIDHRIQTAFGQKPALFVSDMEESTLGTRYVDFLIPGLLAFSLFSTSVFGSGMTIVVNRRENLLKRYRVTPMRSYLFFLSHVLGRLLVTLLEMGCILLAGYLLFDFKCTGDPFALVLVAGLSSVAFCGIAMLCATRFANTSTYNGVANLIVLVMMVFSGIFFARSNFPTWLQDAASYLPLAASADALRLISGEGLGLESVIPQIVILVLCAFVTFVATSLLFTWEARR